MSVYEDNAAFLYVHSNHGVKYLLVNSNPAGCSCVTELCLFVCFLQVDLASAQQSPNEVS